MKYDFTQAQNSFNYLRKYIPKNSRVLDFGSGKGYISQLISEEITSNVKCVDVIDIQDSPLPVVIYDGIKMPFKDNSFDVSICLFVLHHTSDQVHLLKELARVTKKRIIVMEDLTENFFDILMAHIHKLTSYYRYDSRNMKFHNDHDWQKIYRKLGLDIEAMKSISMTRNYLYPIHRKMYVLTPNN